MSVKSRGVSRLVIHLLLRASTASAGFFWAQQTFDASIAAAVAAAFAMLLVFVNESFEAIIHTRMEMLHALLNSANADDLTSDEKASRLEVIFELLEGLSERP